MGQAYGIQQIDVYRFEDLDDEAKEAAMDEYRQGNLDYEWWDSVYDDAKTIGKLMGIDIDRIYFSGFSSQGDGACFEGDYSYEKGSVKAVKDYAPKDKDLHGIAQALYEVQKKAFYGLTATIAHQGHHSHELCTYINVYDGRYDFCYATMDQEEEIKDILRSFMQWIYSSLEASHDYLNSDEQIAESIEANEHLFLEDGTFTYI